MLVLFDSHLLVLLPPAPHPPCRKQQQHVEVVTLMCVWALTSLSFASSAPSTSQALSLLLTYLSNGAHWKAGPDGLAGQLLGDMWQVLELLGRSP